MNRYATGQRAAKFAKKCAEQAKAMVESGEVSWEVYKAFKDRHQHADRYVQRWLNWRSWGAIEDNHTIYIPY